HNPARPAPGLLRPSHMLTAGYARVCISPVAGMPLAVFAARAGACEGVHDDLFARALVLDKGRRTLALVSLDLLAVPATFVGRVAVIDRLRLVDRHRLVSYQGVVLESCAAAREAFVRVLGQGVHRVRVE